MDIGIAAVAESIAWAFVHRCLSLFVCKSRFASKQRTCARKTSHRRSQRALTFSAISDNSLLHTTIKVFTRVLEASSPDPTFIEFKGATENVEIKTDGGFFITGAFPAVLSTSSYEFCSFPSGISCSCLETITRTSENALRRIGPVMIYDKVKVCV